MTLSVAVQHDTGAFHLDARFEAPAGVTVLFGRSGSGKTSVINALAGLIQPKSGRIAVQDRVVFDSARGIDLPPHRRRLGYIFQDARLFPHLSVRQNLDYGRWFARKGRQSDDATRVIDFLGIGALLERKPATLSGGEKQRVAIGRALLSGPDLLLADEPLASLDEPRKAEILPYFERLRDELSVPILYVSHNPAEVARLATTVVVLQDGRVMRHGPAADLLGDPLFVPTSIRAVGAVLSATVRRHHDDGLTELDVGGAAMFLPRVAQPVGQALRIRVPGQDVILSRARPEGLSALNILPGRVTGIRTGDGPGAVIALDTVAGTLLARVTRRSAEALDLAEGVACHAIIKSLAIAPEDIGAPGPKA